MKLEKIKLKIEKDASEDVLEIRKGLQKTINLAYDAVYKPRSREKAPDIIEDIFDKTLGAKMMHAISTEEEIELNDFYVALKDVLAR